MNRSPKTGVELPATEFDFTGLYRKWRSDTLYEGMPLTLNLNLGLAFAAFGFAAASIQYWLWTFPMEPDPSGRDPNGRTTAPKPWRIAHRVLGYGFLAFYIALMAQMLPRLPFLLENLGDLRLVLHAAAGIAIAPILLFKFWILRVQPRYGKVLPKLGTGLIGSALLTVGLVVAPAFRLATLAARTTTESRARTHIQSRCIGCHGASPILAGKGDDDWPKVLKEMQEKARDWRRPDPVGSNAAALAAYLQSRLPRQESEQEGDRRNRRGRRERSEED